MNLTTILELSTSPSRLVPKNKRAVNGTVQFLTRGLYDPK